MIEPPARLRRLSVRSVVRIKGTMLILRSDLTRHAIRPSDHPTFRPPDAPLSLLPSPRALRTPLLLDSMTPAEQASCMPTAERITRNPSVMGGKPCIRNLRITVGTVAGLVAAGKSREEILKLYPYLEGEDITAALTYAAWRAEELEIELRHG